MNNQEQILESLKLADELKGKLDHLLELTNKTLEGLPAQEQGKLAFISQDINGIMKAVKNGDMSQLNQFMSKYANSSK